MKREDAQEFVGKKVHCEFENGAILIAVLTGAGSFPWFDQMSNGYFWKDIKSMEGAQDD